ncbi:DNA repair protein rad50 [Lecanora helva]
MTQICKEKEVLAQVKLSFQTISGDQMVITRNLQLTVKKSTRQQKTLEGSLTTKSKNGERISVSSRVAELDKLMPHHLGVSKAVLDSVIFCHQDESLWPMSEPAPLKKKFDEIFEALKYTKAIENIKALRKGKGEELKRLKDNEQYSKSIKNKGDKAEKDSRELDVQLKELRMEIQSHTAKEGDADRKFQDASDRAAEFKTLLGKLENKHDTLSMLQRNLDQLSTSLEKRDEPDEWLQSELDHYEERMSTHGKAEEQQTRHYQDLERRNKDAEAKLSRKHVEAGKQEEQKANHERLVEERKELIVLASRQHDIRGYDTDLNDTQITEYMNKLLRLLKDQNAAVEKARRKTEKEKEKAQETLNRLAERRSGLKENKNSFKAQINSNNEVLRTKQSELNKIDIDEGGRAILEAQLEDLETQLSKARDSSQQGSFDRKIRENEAQLKTLNEESEQLNDELYQATKQAGELARLDQFKKDAADNARNLQKMKEVHGDELCSVLGEVWEPSQLETQFQSVINQRNRDVKDAGRNRDIVVRGLEQTEYKLSTTRADLKRLETDLKTSENELKTCIQSLTEDLEVEPENYPKMLSRIQHDRDVHKADFDNFENVRHYFTDAIAMAENEKKCKLCSRPFQAKGQEDFVNKMKKNLVSETKNQVAKDLQDTEEDLQSAKEVGPTYDSWVRLSNTQMPKLREDFKRLSDERERILRDLESHDRAVKDKEEVQMEAESLAKPVANITKYQNEFAKLTEQIKELTANQKDCGMPRTVDEIRGLLRILQDKTNDVRNQGERLKTARERSRSLITTLELDLSKANNNLSTAIHQLEKKQDLAKQIGELKATNQGHESTVDRLDTELQDIEPRYADEETKKEEIQRRGLEKERDLQKDVSRVSESVQQLQLAAKQIAAYNDDGGSMKLDICQQDIKDVEQEISRIKDEQRRIIVSINKIRQEVNNQGNTKRTIQDNLQYRQDSRRLEGVRMEIAELSAKNNEADREYWIKQKSHWQRIYNEHHTDKISKLGIAKAKDDELVRLLKDWETEYKDAARNYKKAHIEVETTKAVIEDLGRYASALDKAIMKYHSLKMEEINGIIEELWRKTYQGTDVDTILIRSDNEGAKGNRSYNYRVCMVKQDAEMDMRGRCSAGQKVLASIIIRLALAECFGVNCGLIALDEPTTNLDRDNIRSLALALHDIIEARRHQANFQLIVITHDEEFLKFMKCPDFCDKYWRVSRNERQKSIIEKQSIAEVM